MNSSNRQPATVSTEAEKKKEGFCLNCGKPLDLAECYWRRFCNDSCRNKYNIEAARIGREVLRERKLKQL